MNIYRYGYVSRLVWRLVLCKPRFRRWLTELIFKNENRDITLFGSPLHINTLDEIGYYNAYRTAGSNIVFRDEVGSLLNLALLLESTDTFVDIGANVGLYSSLLNRLQYLFHDLPWHAFEANPATAKRLARTLAGKNVVIHTIALSDQDGSLQFAGGAVSGVFGCVNGHTGFADLKQLTTVPTKRLDGLSLLGNALVLKVDVEGHEGEVLHGAQGLFDEGRVKAVYLDGYSDKKIPDFLRSNGFALFDGRTMCPCATPDFSLLAIHKEWIARQQERSASAALSL